VTGPSATLTARELTSRRSIYDYGQDEGSRDWGSSSCVSYAASLPQTSPARSTFACRMMADMHHSGSATVHLLVPVVIALVFLALVALRARRNKR
jgi:hypothetical protein